MRIEWIRAMRAIADEAERRHDDGYESVDVHNFLDQAMVWMIFKGSQGPVTQTQTLEEVLKLGRKGGM